MNKQIQTCKCHWVGEEYLHWGRLDGRKPFTPPGTLNQFAPDTPVVARHFKLELHLDFETEQAKGVSTHHLEVQADSLTHFALQAKNLEISQVRLNGKNQGFVNTGDALEITLEKPFAKGDSFTLEATHSVTKPAAGLYFTTPDEAYPDRFHTVWSQGQDEDSRYYFPCLDAPCYKQTTEALLYVPKGMFALSNGALITHKKGPKEDLWHYKLDIPYSTYLFSVVAGDFMTHSEKAGEVDVSWHVQKGREGEGKNAFGDTADILKFFGELTGHPYPFSRYTQIAVPDFVFGGMENFTVTTQTDLTLHDDRAHLDFSSNDLVAHEAAHTWFGNMVTARSWAHAWLHESFATYLEALYTRHTLGEDEFDYQMRLDAESYFFEDAQYQRPLVTHRYEEPIDLFDAHLYPGGAVRLRHLHHLLGEDAFKKTLKLFLENHKWGLAETIDLARAVQSVTGKNYDWWFSQWIFSAGCPSLDVTYAWKEEEKQAELTIRQTAPLNEGDPKQKAWFRLPLEVSFFSGKDKISTLPLVLDKEEARFILPQTARPKMVLLDPAFSCPVKRVKFKKPQEMWVHQLHHGPKAADRIEAAVALGEKPSASSVKALGTQLKKDPFWGTQQRIASALGKIGGKAARDALLAGLKLTHPKGRRGVVSILGHFRDDPKVAKALEKKAEEGDPSYYVEAETARALGAARTPQALTLLKKFLDKPAHFEAIRTGAFDGLAKLENPETLPLIAKGLAYGAPAMSRAAAIRAAGALGRRFSNRTKEVLDLLGPVAEQKDNPAATFRGKLAAIRALGSLGELDALPLLRRVAGAEADGRISRLARETAAALRADAKKPQELGSLREDLDTVLKENKSLRDRVQNLEVTQKKKPHSKDKG